MSRGRVLIVEDNGATRKMMRIALQAEGYEVAEAEDGETALRLVAERLPELVLLDCRLPDIDGFEVARRLSVSAPGLPLVGITGWVHSDEARVLRAGFLDVLVKPVEPSRLVEVVGEYVGRAPARTAEPGKLVLLADDDAGQRKLAQLALASAGFEVVLAEDGEAALRLAGQRRPDAVVSDVLMPKMDGFELCRALRGDPKLAGVPIVLMSAHYLEDEDRALASRFGATRYVSRTAGFDDVVRGVVEAIEAPATGFTAPSAEELQAEYLRRIAHQLERQANIGTRLARRVSLQATALSVLDHLSDSLSRQLDPESALTDTLAECLDAAGLSVGAILLRDGGGGLVLKAHVGSLVDLQLDAHEAIWSTAVELGGLMVPSPAAGESGAALLAAVRAASALIVPIVARDQPLGVLLFASNGTDLAGSEGESFVRAARSVSKQLGQALALSRVFSRLAAAEQRYRALFENVRDAIAIVSTEGVILESNRGWEALLGLPRAKLVGRPVFDFVPAGERAARAREFAEAVEQGGGIVTDASIERPDGKQVRVELSRTLVSVGAERYVVSIGRDITERVRLEEQLRQAQKMEAVGRLAGGVAHDFNNLLSVIVGYGDLILEDLKSGDPLRDDVEQIRNAGKRGSDLTRQLLMFSRQQVIEPKVLDLNELLTRMGPMLRRLIGEDVELVFSLEPALGMVRADPGSVEQAVMNLVVNARDALPSGGRLAILTENATLDRALATRLGLGSGRHVTLAVRDTGTGMDSATQARIFEPFFTTKDSSKGTGLGLSTVFGIMRQSAGGIAVDSELGKGSKFTLYFPRVDATPHSLLPVKAPTPMHGSETILVVEDDEQVRAVVAGILRRNKYVVIETRSPREALVACEKNPAGIDLLLTDVVMPQMSGPELAGRLTALRPTLKVLYVSGYTDDRIGKHGELAADIAFLQKPITALTLTRKVREVLDAPGNEPSRRPA
jgi:PAS domain S-box-containing protein